MNYTSSPKKRKRKQNLDIDLTKHEMNSENN